jgi:hypothetical protein
MTTHPSNSTRSFFIWNVVRKGSALGFVAIILSCSSPFSNLPPYDLPPENTSLDPSEVRPPSLAFLCGYWVGDTPHPDSAVLLDLNFGNLSPSDPIDRPLEVDRDLIRRHGGRILRVFQFPAFRVWIRAGAIPALVHESRRQVSVLRVADPRRFDWQFTVLYRASHPYTDDDEVKLTALGARITHRLAALNMLAGVIPNRMVPGLRSDKNVVSVEGAPPWPNCST